MIELIERVGMMFVVFLMTINLMAAFMLLHNAGTYYRDKNRREEAEARMKVARSPKVPL